MNEMLENTTIIFKDNIGKYIFNILIVLTISTHQTSFLYFHHLFKIIPALTGIYEEVATNNV